MLSWISVPKIIGSLSSMKESFPKRYVWLCRLCVLLLYVHVVHVFTHDPTQYEFANPGVIGNLPEAWRTSASGNAPTSQEEANCTGLLY